MCFLSCIRVTYGKRYEVECVVVTAASNSMILTVLTQQILKVKEGHGYRGGTLKLAVFSIMH